MIYNDDFFDDEEVDATQDDELNELDNENYNFVLFMKISTSIFNYIGTEDAENIGRELLKLQKKLDSVFSANDIPHDQLRVVYASYNQPFNYKFGKFAVCSISVNSDSFHVILRFCIEDDMSYNNMYRLAVNLKNSFMLYYYEYSKNAYISAKDIYIIPYTGDEPTENHLVNQITNPDIKRCRFDAILAAYNVKWKTHGIIIYYLYKHFFKVLKLGIDYADYLYGLKRITHNTDALRFEEKVKEQFTKRRNTADSKTILNMGHFPPLEDLSSIETIFLYNAHNNKSDETYQYPGCLGKDKVVNLNKTPGTAELDFMRKHGFTLFGTDIAAIHRYFCVYDSMYKDGDEEYLVVGMAPHFTHYYNSEKKDVEVDENVLEFMVSIFRDEKKAKEIIRASMRYLVGITDSYSINN